MRINRGLALASLFTSLFGCSDFRTPPDRYGLAIDPNLNPDQMQSVIDAAQEWMDRTGVYIQVSVSDHRCGPSLLQPSWGCTSLRLVDPGSLTPPAVGNTAEETNLADKLGFSSNIVIYNNLNPRAFYKAARHELGHAIGLLHEPGTAMDPYISGAPDKLTCRDVAQYQSVRFRVVDACDMVGINQPYEKPSVDDPPTPD